MLAISTEYARESRGILRRVLRLPASSTPPEPQNPDLTTASSDKVAWQSDRRPHLASCNNGVAIPDEKFIISASLHIEGQAATQKARVVGIKWANNSYGVLAVNQQMNLFSKVRSSP